jgi:hypothetical protein
MKLGIPAAKNVLKIIVAMPFQPDPDLDAEPDDIPF